MRRTLLSLALTVYLSSFVNAADPGDARFATTYVKASINVELKGILRFSADRPSMLDVKDRGNDPVQGFFLDAKLREQLSKLDGKVVVVTGTCGLRTVAIPIDKPSLGDPPTPPGVPTYRTAIDFDWNVSVTTVKEAEAK